MSAAEGSVSHRINLRFSAEGRFSTSVVADRQGRFTLRAWELGPAGPRHRFDVAVPDLIPTVGLPLADGRTALVEHGVDSHRLTELDAEGRGGDPIRLAPCALVPPPAGCSALAVGLRSEGSRSVVLLVDRDGATELAAVDGAPVRGWPAGDRGLILATATGTAYSLDLRTGALECLPDEIIPPGMVLLGVSGAHFLLAAQGNSGSRLFSGSRVAPPRELHLPEVAGSAVPVALDPSGRRAALVAERGATSQLVLVGEGGSRVVATGLTSLTPAAAWTEHGLWGIGSGPDRPAGYYHVPPGETAPRWSTPAEDGPPVRLETLPSAAGDLEAVRYGPDWRSAPQIVLALHGGPREHWRAAYDPALRMLAGTGACVLALNQRGSTGYGSDFELAIKGCWGGPDLADVLAVAAWLRRHGAANPVLWGVSYGAYLALLAAAAEPDGWAGCVAVSPFVSAASLDAVAGPRVRALIGRLDGCRPVEDDLGARDLVRLAPRIRCPTLIAHGALDRTIPVDQARAIVSAMIAGPAGNLLRYLEIPGRDHGVLRPHPDEAVMRAATDLIRESALVFAKD
ncbi:MAG: S9 family peptidase [Actinobacteria bacterium]|nr:S9 family peptidase [Actinomycetota bacterium]